MSNATPTPSGEPKHYGDRCACGHILGQHYSEAPHACTKCDCKAEAPAQPLPSEPKPCPHCGLGGSRHNSQHLVGCPNRVPQPFDESLPSSPEATELETELEIEAVNLAATWGNRRIWGRYQELRQTHEVKDAIKAVAKAYASHHTQQRAVEARIEELETLITLLNRGEYEYSDEPSKALKFPNNLILNRIANLKKGQTNE